MKSKILRKTTRYFGLWFVLFFLCIGSFGGCDTPEIAAERLEIGKPYVLTDWPDSSYVQSLDSVLAAEPLKKADSTERTNIVLNSGSLNSDDLLPNKFSLNAKPSNNRKETENHAKAKVAKQEKKSTNKNISAEIFAGRFSEAISQWQSDPNNKNLYVEVIVQNGENALDAMARIYGNGAKRLPKFYALSALQSLNPGISVENPKAGAIIRLPKM